MCFRARNTNVDSPVLGPDVDRWAVSCRWSSDSAMAFFRSKSKTPNMLGPDVDSVRCLLIQVVRPILSWTDWTDSSNSTSSASSSPGNSSASVVGRLTPTNGSVFETFPGCYLELPLYATSVWYKTVFGFRTWVQEFSGAFTLLDASSIDGATIETPHPSSMISPTTYSNIPTNYSYSALFRFQPSLDTHTHSRTHSHTTLTDIYSSR